MLFAGKWVELEIIIFREISQAYTITWFHSYTDSKSKIRTIIMIITAIIT
jgi:hypothetical protein